MKTFYERNLPHIVPVGAKFFLTFRLYDSYSNNLIKQILENRDDKINSLIKTKLFNYKTLIVEERKRTFALIDKMLDASDSPNCFLKDDNIAEVVKRKLHQYDGNYYTLIAYSIMPNHVHLVIDTAIQLNEMDDEILDTNYVQLEKFMKLIKGGSAFEANKILNRTGQFWHRESYDHIVRNEKELSNIIIYVLENPVKAKLVDTWQDWKFNYVNEKYL